MITLPWIFVKKSIADLGTGSIISITFGVTSLLGFVLQTLQEPLTIAILGITVWPLLYFASIESQKSLSSNVTWRDPEDNAISRSKDGSAEEITISNETAKVTCEVSVPDWANRHQIRFKQQRGYEVRINQNPGGTETIEGNEIIILDNMESVGFQLLISRTSEGQGIYSMEVNDVFHGFDLHEMRIRLN